MSDLKKIIRDLLNYYLVPAHEEAILSQRYDEARAIMKDILDAEEAIA